MEERVDWCEVSKRLGGGGNDGDDGLVIEV